MKKIIECGNSEIIKEVCKETLSSPILVNKQLATIFNEEPYVVYIKEKENSEMYTGIKVFSYFEDIPSEIEYSWAIFYFQELDTFLIRNSIWEKEREIEYLQDHGITDESFNLDTMKSMNVYLDKEDSLKVKRKLGKLKEKFTEFTGYEKNEKQKPYGTKKVYLCYFDYERTETWNYPLENKEASYQINIFIDFIKSIIKTNNVKIYEIELDYRCPLNVYYKYIRGDKDV